MPGKMTWVWTNRPAGIVEVLAQVGAGWQSLLEELIKDLFVLGWNGGLMQVKEKFGGLRFYIGAAADDVPERTTKDIHERIEKAEAESLSICEKCGLPGKPQGGKYGWTMTVCEGCQEERLR